MRNDRVVARLRKLKEEVEAGRDQQSGECEGQQEERKLLELCKNESHGKALVLKSCCHHQNHSVRAGREQRRKAPAPLSFHLPSLAGAFYWLRNREQGIQDHSVFKDETPRAQGREQSVEWMGGRGVGGGGQLRISSTQGNVLDVLTRFPLSFIPHYNLAGSIVIYKWRKQTSDPLNVSKVTQVRRGELECTPRSVCLQRKCFYTLPNADFYTF